MSEGFFIAPAGKNPSQTLASLKHLSLADSHSLKISSSIPEIKAAAGTPAGITVCQFTAEQTHDRNQDASKHGHTSRVLEGPRGPARDEAPGPVRNPH